MKRQLGTVVTKNGETLSYVDLFATVGKERLANLPYSLRVVLENIVRNQPGSDGGTQIDAVLRRDVGAALSLQIPRVIMPDSTGVPILMDLAAMRDALVDEEEDPACVDAKVKADLVVDHSLQVDSSGSSAAYAINAQREFDRNSERYVFLKWAQSSFDNLTIHPPGSGIIHQLNLESIAPVVCVETDGQASLTFPDMVVGSDSHTPMINALGVVGWGVGGIEAETVLLGQPYSMAMPAVVGVRLSGTLRPGVTTTDLALTVTERLRQTDLVGKFVEFCGPAIPELSIPDRATLSNMAPEYGATIGFWPIDERTLEYLSNTARSQDDVDRIEQFAKAAGFFRDADVQPEFDEMIEIDLRAVSTSMAGPSRPQDRIDLHAVATSFSNALNQSRHEGGFGVRDGMPMSALDDVPTHGAVVIAAITSCTNTANPSVMVRAGLMAQRAAQLGLVSKPWVKTSLAPGSRVVTGYLEDLGLMEPLRALGFDVVGYGCTTCGGKSGPLLPEAEAAITENDLVAVSVLSGNRNFSGRIHKLVRGNYLGSPALVVAYALAGRITIDFEHDPLGQDHSGKPVYLADIWPEDQAVQRATMRAGDKSFYQSVYGVQTEISAEWNSLMAPTGQTFSWDSQSQYLMAPPFLKVKDRQPGQGLNNARILGLYGHSLTTDHVSPGGEIPVESPAGEYLLSKGIEPRGFNTYVGRRGNHEVMKRATFANIRIQNRLAPETEGWWTKIMPSGQTVSVFDAANSYAQDDTPLIVVGGREYGTGSSRDWAAKGPALLGVRAVLALSFERIHRANLAAMGIVPLTFSEPSDFEQIDGTETVSIDDLYGQLLPGADIRAKLTKADGTSHSIPLIVDLRTPTEARFILSGNVLKTALQQVTRIRSVS
ncbi:aconitate hydratase AcnA [Pelagibacterium sp.]|uniref:aconitate hydratase AcnA n=1 Tax=Pelagibacterium sp. TaxID=1967288 RepID=UPI003BA9F942